jgi:hypothetical protein
MAAPLTVLIARTTMLTNDNLRPTNKESVSAILTRCKTSLIADWLKRIKDTPQLNHLDLSDDQRAGHLRSWLTR